MPLSPPPSSIPLTDDMGHITHAWSVWFQEIYNNNNYDTLIKKVDCASNESISMSMPPVYKTYKIDLQKVVISKAGVSLKLYISNDYGANYTDTNILKTMPTITTDSTALTGEIIIEGVQTADYKTTFHWVLKYMNGTEYVTLEGSATDSELATINNIKLELSSGNFESGRIKLLGTKQ